MFRRRSSDARRSQIVKSTGVPQTQPSGEPAGDEAEDAAREAEPAIEDLRDLEAPQPLERVLAATSTLAPGESYAARVPRYPRLLLPRLEERGLLYEVDEEPDGTALVRVRRPT